MWKMVANFRQEAFFRVSPGQNPLCLTAENSRQPLGLLAIYLPGPVPLLPRQLPPGFPKMARSRNTASSMPDELATDAFLARPPGVPVIDVRTPDEFALGHIPGALNVPLFL